MAPYVVLVFFGVILLVILLRARPFRHVTVYEYQKALRYKHGRYVCTLDPGQYWIMPAFSSIIPVDIRAEFITIPGQDVLSADGVTLRISLAAEFQVVNPNVAVNKNANYRTSLYLALQLALREIVGKEKIDAVVENRAGISAKLAELTSMKIPELGLKLISADVKDIMFPGEMKKAFGEVVKAQKQAQAALERARGETAALRNLANAARMIEDNPNLLPLRALQALADSSGNSLVWGLPNHLVPLGKKGETKRGPAPEESGKAE